MKKGTRDKLEAIKLARFVLQNKHKDQLVEEALNPIAEKFGYKSWRTIYVYLMTNMDSDLEFKEWWNKNKQKQPKPKENGTD